MQVDILTLFPEMFSGPFDKSIIKRAQNEGLITLNIHQLRNWAEGPHQIVDDRPYGGGVGMVLMIEPIYKAVKEIKIEKNSKVLLTSPRGKSFTQKMAQEFSTLNQLIIIAGHYEGFDERIIESVVDEEISLGDFVLTGGEIPAMAITDSVVRLIPGVLHKEDATRYESFSDGLLEYPHYTRPENFQGMKVPEVLLSGNHKLINEWRKNRSWEKTKAVRPDLITNKNNSKT